MAGARGCVGFLFSYPAYITIAAFYLTVCICCKCKDKILLSLVPAGLCTLAYGVLNLGKTHSSAYLSEYWKKGFEIFSIEIYKINFDFLFQYYSFPLLLQVFVIYIKEIDFVLCRYLVFLH